MDKNSSPQIFAMSGQDALSLMRKANTPYLKGLKAAADYLGVSRATVCRMKRDGRLAGTFWQVNRIVLFDKTQLNKLIKKQN